MSGYISTGRDESIVPQNKLFLHVAIMDSFDGRKLQKLTPDENGYFNGMPLSAFNAKSLNGCYYDTQSYYDKLTNPSSPFNIKLTHGNLYGEWGHPKTVTDLNRIMMVDRDQQSHHFKAIYVDDKDRSAKYPIIRGDLIPSGPKGKYLRESLMNPYENTAFSLRCLMTEKFDKTLNAPVRRVEEFVTFDAVDMPGYLYASKWYVEKTATGKECLFPITLDMLYDAAGKRVAMESYADDRILQLFGIEDFDLDGKPLGHYIKGTNTYTDRKSNRKSIAHQVLSRKYF